MNTVSNGVYRPAQKLHPLSLLTQYASQDAAGCLQISSSGSAWFLYLEQGSLVYASDLTDPFGRLDRHLRLLSIQSPSLVGAIRVQMRLMFEEMPADQPSLNSDYRAICWLVEQQHLMPDQAATLIEAMAREVIGAFLPIQMGSHRFIEQDLLADLPRFCQLDLRQLAEDGQSQFQRRQSVLPSQALPNRLRLNRLRAERRFDSGIQLPEQARYRPLHDEYQGEYQGEYQAEYQDRYQDKYQDKYQDRLQDGHQLDSPPVEPAGGIQNNLQEPAALFAEIDFEAAAPIEPAHRLTPDAAHARDAALDLPAEQEPSMQTAPPGIPGIPPLSPAQSEIKPLTPQWFASHVQNNPQNHLQEGPNSASEVNTKKYTIACIDDSPTVLQAINSFLDDKSFLVVLVSDPIKALMQVIRSRPDLILLDVTMPNLDGYELCSLLRKHPSFRGTPIVMVTSNTSFIDRAKARLVGASGYLTKPFTQTDLIKIVFKHLS